ncbi:unnamed protein product [Dovyalis caffra]|uniref:Uncharacterized protein n=1 Tax=Dovyalis caffra TaxID=77055 RepID=A0AAV1RLN4_9ROSI|nr:unnamed protein product [Dovyalis caffra]
MAGLQQSVYRAKFVKARKGTHVAMSFIHGHGISSLTLNSQPVLNLLDPKLLTIYSEDL